MEAEIDFEQIWEDLEDIEEPETRFVRAILTIKGPCAACGKHDWIPTVKHAKSLCDCMQRVWVTHPGLLSSIGRLSFLCKQCMSKTDEEKTTAILRERVSNATSYALGKEFIGLATLSMSEATHEKAVEDVNPLCWQIALDFSASTDNLWIHGATGVGKTFFARYILNKMLNLGWTVGEITGTQWVERSMAFDKHIRFRRELSKQRLVLIDDIDKAPWTEQALDAYFDFLNYRYDAKLKLLVTSNTKPEFMLSRGDPAKNIPMGIFRRIAAQNASKAEAIMERMLPMERIYLVGDSLRKTALRKNEEGSTDAKES